MALMLVRYGEIGLKSASVRRRFERSLVENIENAFLAARRECRVERERGRVYVRSDDMAAATATLRKVFGIVSFSPVEEIPSSMDEIKSRSAAFAGGLIGDGESFAVRATRSGSHRYTSMDVAREAGQSILDAVKGKGASVDLGSPGRTIFIEVRGARAFLFSSSTRGPGGLPMGSQGKVLAIVERAEDAVAAWLMMRRGCKAALLAEDEGLAEPLGAWDPNLRVHKSLGDAPEKLAAKLRCQAIVVGATLDGPGSLRKGESLPWLHPLVGLPDVRIREALASIMNGVPPDFGQA
jgi:thiamine biosynthesis protein ThiI